MKIQPFLQHHGIASNPFADEDAQSDLVFKGHCIKSAFHPTWDKIYGNPREPATAIVFGEKGSGKTALRLQIVRHLTDFNAENPGERLFVVQYDDFNPYLDRFRERFHGRHRRPDHLVGQWKLWDHMDVILALGVTQLVDRVLRVEKARHPASVDSKPLPVDRLDKAQARDLLLLAACYDQSFDETGQQRWHALRKALGFRVWPQKWDLGVGLLVTVAALATAVGMQRWEWLATWWFWLVVAAGWLPRLWRTLKSGWRAWGVKRNTWVLNQNAKRLRRIFQHLADSQIVGQPLPVMRRTDDRYEMLAKLQNVLNSLGFGGIIVLVDRVDEPYLINGSPELMRGLVWPMLDNKLLKHPGVGFKLLLPIELSYFIDREDRDFHQRARLDKQNLIRSLQWSGQSLFDVANARLQAVAQEGRTPVITDLFEESIDQQRLIERFRSLRVPRHLFRFLYRVVVEHTNAHTDETPAWQISAATFESVMATYLRDLDAMDRGTGAG